MGANITREDPIQYLNCVGFAREYHSWVIDEGDVNKVVIVHPPDGIQHETNCSNNVDDDGDGLTDCNDLGDCSCASALYPNNVCKWNPGYQGLSNELFPAFYQNVVGSLGESSPSRVPICVSLNHTLPSLLSFVPNSSNEGSAAEYKPIFPTGFATDDPRSYEYYADYLTQFSRHFGGSPSVAVPSKQPNQPMFSTAIVGYIEPWNEPDKNSSWFVDPGPNASQVGFTKEEYAALAKAVYNGNSAAMNGDLPNGSHYPLGVSNFFPQIKMVMAGISEFDAPNLTYIDQILSGVPDLDVVNIHHYCDSNWKGGPAGISDVGVSPELDNGTMNGEKSSFKKALSYLKTRYQTYPSPKSRELWLTEFGWDTNNGPQRAPSIPANNAFGGINKISDQQEVQGCWIVRAYLEASAAGCEKAVVYFLRDADSKPGAGLFQSSGLVQDKINGYQPKKSYWYVSTLKSILGETTFVQENSSDIYGTSYTSPRIMKYTGIVPGFTGNNVKVFAVWTPTQNNETYKRTGATFFEGIDAEGQTFATMIKMQPNDANGVRTALTIVNGKVRIPAEEANERPIFVVLGQEAISDPVLACVNFLPSQPLACDAVKVAWTVPVGQTFDHYLIYYYDRADSQSPVSPTFDIGDPYWKLYTGNLTGSCNQVVIAGLPRPYDNVPVVVIGVTAAGVLTPACPVTVQTAGCKGDAIIMPNHFISVTPTDCNNLLFDYTGFDFCSADPVEITSNEWSNNVGSTCASAEVTVVLDGPYKLDVIRFLDGSSDGQLQIFYDTDTNTSSFDNEAAPLVFNTNYFNVWRSFVFPVCNANIRRLKFRMSTDNGSRVKKIALYGSPASGYTLPQCCGSSAALAITDKSTSQVAGLSTAQEIVVTGTLTIDGTGFTFGQAAGLNGPDLFMKPGAKIVVNPGATLTVQGNSIAQGCEQMWQGIEVKPGGKVFFTGGSTIRDAYKAFRVLRPTTNSTVLSQVSIDNANLLANLHGLYVESANPYTGTLTLSMNSTRVDGLGIDLKPAYSGQPSWEYRSNSGIFGSRMGTVTVSGSMASPSRFARLNYGIFGEGSTLQVSMAKFSDILQRPSTIFGAGPVGGYGIYLTKSNLYQSGFGKYGPKSFDNVYTAIRLVSGATSVKDNNGDGLDYGLVASSLVTVGDHITNNAFIYRKGGMSFSASRPPVVVTNNSVIGADNKASYGIAASGFATSVADGQIYDIRNNFALVRGEPVVPPPTVIGAGIYLNNKVSCNIMDSIRTGLELRLNCNTPNGIQGNILLNTDKGVRAADNPGAAVILGQQAYRGNLWINNPAKYELGASYEGNLDYVPQERFTVNSTGTSTYIDPSGGASYTLSALPPSFTTNPDWFQNPFPPQSNLVCGQAGTQQCQENRLVRRLDGDGRYKNIAKGLDQMTGLSAVYQWMIRRSIYGDLREKYAGMSIPGEFFAFYNAQTNTTVQKGWELDRSIATIGRSNLAAVNRLRVVDSLAYQAFFKGENLTVALVRERDSLNQVVDARVQADLAAAKTQNQNYVVSAPYELLDKEINTIYLNDFVGQASPVTANLPRVEAIADLCPETDGPAVFKARGMHVMAGGLPKATWDICNAEVKRRDQEADNKTTVPIVRVYPNPAQTMLYIESSIYAAHYKVYSMIGTEIRQGYLEEHLATIDISLLSNGLYLLIVDGLPRPVKFVVSH